MNTRERSTQRSACDRCHGQKLRCIRGPLLNGACQRCIKARETCQYSPPLRLGRPVNKPDPENGPRGGSAASSSPNESFGGTDGAERQSDEDALMDFQELGFSSADIALPIQEEQVFDARNLVFPTPAGPERMQHGAHTGSRQELSNFILDGYGAHFIQDPAYSLDSPMAKVTDVFGTTKTSPRGGLSVETLLAQPNTVAGLAIQPNAQDDARRQLSEMLRGLYETPCHSPMESAPSNAHSSNLQLMDETVKAAHTLLGIIDSLQAPEGASAPNRGLFADATADAAGPCVDACTGFLIAACYSRIFRNSNALATVLHDAVSSNDMAALRSMPSIQIGSVPPLHTTSPAIQSALWVQLLWQSLRELEKRLLTLPRSTVLASSVPELGVRPLNRSHVADLATAVDADVARLEVGVNHLLKTTLDTLRHKTI